MSASDSTSNADFAFYEVIYEDNDVLHTACIRNTGRWDRFIPSDGRWYTVKLVFDRSRPLFWLNVDGTYVAEGETHDISNNAKRLPTLLKLLDQVIDAAI
jgi:hypothetical protein